jgi:hypothetical protein
VSGENLLHIAGKYHEKEENKEIVEQKGDECTAHSSSQRVAFEQ